MKNWVSRRTLAFAVAVIAAAIPALGQEGPESLLPPGFGPPAPSRPVAPAVPSAPAPATEGQAEAAPAAELPDQATASEEQIGRAPCGGRGWQYGEIPGGAGS